MNIIIPGFQTRKWIQRSCHLLTVREPLIVGARTQTWVFRIQVHCSFPKQRRQRWIQDFIIMIANSHGALTENRLYLVLCSYFLIESPQLCEMSTVITILSSQMRKPSHGSLNNVFTPLATSDTVAQTQGLLPESSLHIYTIWHFLCV